MPRTGVGGLSAEMIEAMLGMDDEQTEKMLRMIRSNFTEEVGGDPEMVIGGIKKFVQERKRRREVQREEETGKAKEKQEKEVRTGRGNAGLVQGEDERCRGNEASGKGKGKGREGKVEHGKEGGQGGIDVPVVLVVQVPRVWVVKKTVEDPQFEIVEKTVENPEAQTIQGSDMLVTQVQVVEKTVETLQQNKILRVIKKNHVMKCMDMFNEIAELNDDRKKFYEQFVKCMKLGIRENSVDDLEIAELLRFNTSMSGDENRSASRNTWTV